MSHILSHSIYGADPTILKCYPHFVDDEMWILKKKKKTHKLLKTMLQVNGRVEFKPLLT